MIPNQDPQSAYDFQGQSIFAPFEGLVDALNVAGEQGRPLIHRAWFACKKAKGILRTS